MGVQLSNTPSPMVPLWGVLVPFGWLKLEVDPTKVLAHAFVRRRRRRECVLEGKKALVMAACSIFLFYFFDTNGQRNPLQKRREIYIFFFILQQPSKAGKQEVISTQAFPKAL
jgi:hypothetical protein